MDIKNIDLNWWNKNKMFGALLSAIIFWLVSMACFVYGLSFKNQLGITIGSIDLSLIIAFSLSIANTFIQIVGNEKKKEDMDSLFYFGWIASYALGIGSNVNTLIGILGFSNIYIQWMICIGLGTMIEVLPEKMLVQFFRSLKSNPKSEEVRENKVSSSSSERVQKSHSPISSLPTRNVPVQVQTQQRRPEPPMPQSLGIPQMRSAQASSPSMDYTKHTNTGQDARERGMELLRQQMLDGDDI